MKKFICVVLMSVSTFAVARVPGVSPVDEVCRAYSELVSSIQEANQVGVPITKAIDVVEPERRAQVIAEYRVPRFNSKALQEKMILEASNNAYVACMTR